MNSNQKIVLVVGCVLLIAAGLYPPWVQSWKFVAGGEDVVFRIEPGSEGYAWIFQPPGPPSWVDRNLRTLGEKAVVGEGNEDGEIPAAPRKLALKSVRMPGSWRARIDILRLLVEWAMIAACVVVGIACFAPRETALT